MQLPAWWISHPLFLQHEMGEGHPECPERLRAIEGRMLSSGLDMFLHHLQAPAASVEDLARVHEADHIESVLRTRPTEGYQRIDPDTLMNAYTAEAALHAAGAGIAGVDLVLDGKASFVFCAVRPPGHHAERHRGMGFCLFNNIAVAAGHALSRGLKRVAIVDFDVHYGNGTADIFTGDPRVLLCNTYQFPLYPDWQGDPHRRDRIDVALPPGASGEDFRHEVEARWAPALDAFKPELILVSAGFDAHHRDPLADLRFTEADYEWVGNFLHRVAQRHCKNRLVAMLEGGYDVTALSRSVEAFVRAFVVE